MLDMASGVAAFVLFCAVVKWQPFHSRLHLPLFVLSAPVIGVALSRCRPKWLGSIMVSLMMVYSLPWLFFNATRPLLGPQSILSTAPTTQIFATHPVLEESFKEVAREISASDCNRIGLVMQTEDNWEYPLWKLLVDGGNSAFRIEHIQVDNVSNRIVRDEFRPCAVVSIFRSAPAEVRFPSR